METVTGHWDGRDIRDTLIVLCPRMSQLDPSNMAWRDIGDIWDIVPYLSHVPADAWQLEYEHKLRLYQPDERAIERRDLVKALPRKAKNLSI